MKTHFTQFIMALLLFVGGILTTNEVSASHIMGSDLTYECLGGNKYKIRLTLYRDCAGINMNTSETVVLTSATCGVNTSMTVALEAGYPVEVSNVCSSQIGNTTCNGGTLQGVQEFVYSGIITLTQACSDWTFSYSNCCRNYAITTGSAGESYYIAATLNNLVYTCNNSPDFTNKPIPYFGLNQPASYSHSTTELDGDSVVYSLVTPLQDATTPITFNAPYSLTYPISTTTSTFPIVPSTGQMNFTPNAIQNGVLAVLVREYRGGVLIGSVRRDIQIIVINGANGAVTLGPITNLSGATQVGPTSLRACAGSTITFDVQAYDPNGTSPIVTSNINVGIPGATLTQSGFNPKTMTFSWTPPASAVGGNLFAINVTDDFCPIPSLVSVQYVITVTGAKIYTEDDSICLGQTSALKAYIVGNTAGTFTWTGAGLSSTSASNPNATPPSLPSDYTLTYSVGGCTSRDTLTIHPAGTANATPPVANVCAGQTVQLNSTATLPNYLGYPISCGTVNQTCIGSTVLYTLGTSNINANTLFQGGWHDGRAQYIYLASELAAAGIKAGRISTIGFDVKNKNSSQAYQNFTIKIGCTNMGAVGASFVSGLVPYYSGNYTPASGWNTFTLSTPYQWDGTSNLIVEVCFDNSSFTSNDNVRASLTGFNSALFAYANFANGCGLTAMSSSNTRPNIRVNHCSFVPNISYAWSPTTGLSASTIQNPVVTAQPGTTSYILTATRSTCIARDTVVINTDNLVAINPVSPGLCLGDTVQLNATTLISATPTIPASCALSASSCSTPDIVNIGTGTTNVSYPFLAYYEDGRTQILYTAAELIAAGVKPGLISSLALNISNKGSGTAVYNGLTIALKCVSLTALTTTFQTGFTNVYSGNYTTVAGWNTFNFPTAYEWDGTSNLLVQICFNNAAYSYYDMVRASSTSFNSVCYREADGATGCTMTGATTNTVRPNIRFGNCQIVTPLSYVWSPSTGLTNPNIANPKASPTSNTTYTVTVSSSSCNANKSVAMNVSPCILPQSELKFSAYLRSNDAKNFVDVQWISKTEEGVKLYQLERRYADEENFSLIASVDAVGNAITPSEYGYDDYALRPITANQTIYYRLKQIDIEGTTYYSEILDVYVSPDKNAIQYSLYPNPAEDIVNVEFDFNDISADEVSVTVTDGAGREMKMPVTAAGNRIIALDVKDLSNGTYFLTLKAADGRKAHTKFIVAK